MKHHYGPQVHWIDAPLLNGLLAELCHPETYQPRILDLVEELYRFIISQAASDQLLKEDFQEPTRMSTMHPEVFLRGQRVMQDQSAIVVNLARAGTFPSHLCYRFLHHVLSPLKIRQDHIFAARLTNNFSKVTHTELGASKIGGSVENSTIFFPDPMGATGGTLSTTLHHYKKNIPGKARKYVALHLIITPEYIRHVLQEHPDLEIYTLRVDRGLSSPDILKTIPGEKILEEKGLNEKDYIVPGGGGLGEILNNSFV